MQHQNCLSLIFPSMNLFTVSDLLFSAITTSRNERLIAGKTSDSELRSKEHSDEFAVRKCIDHLMNHQKDLTEHLSATLYERSASEQTSSSFAHALITAAANADESRKKTGNASTDIPLYPVSTMVQHRPPAAMEQGLGYDAQLMAFFAKTPPPPRYRRPFRYRGHNNHQSGYRNFSTSGKD